MQPSSDTCEHCDVVLEREPWLCPNCDRWICAACYDRDREAFDERAEMLVYIRIAP